MQQVKDVHQANSWSRCTLPTLEQAKKSALPATTISNVQEECRPKDEFTMTGGGSECPTMPPMPSARGVKIPAVDGQATKSIVKMQKQTSAIYSPCSFWRHTKYTKRNICFSVLSSLIVTQAYHISVTQCPFSFRHEIRCSVFFAQLLLSRCRIASEPRVHSRSALYQNFVCIEIYDRGAPSGDKEFVKRRTLNFVLT